MTNTFTKPSGLAVGDLMVMEAALVAEATVTPSLPSGWTIPSGATTSRNSATFAQTYVAYKEADSGDVAATNFTFDGTVSGGLAPYAAFGVIKRITGARTSSPITATPTNQTTTSGTTGTFPSATTTSPDNLVLLSAYLGNAAPTGSQFPNVVPSGTTASTSIIDGTNFANFGTAYFTQSTAGATGSKTVTADDMSDGAFQAITFAIAPAVFNQTLTPSLFTNTPTFYAPTVTRGSVTLTPSLFTNSNTFYTPTVTRGAVTLTPSLFTDTNTFYSPTVTQAGGTQTLTPSLFTNANTFYAPTVSPGSVTLTPGLFTNTSSFYAPAVTRGTVTLTPALFTNASTFYAPTVTRGAVSLSPALFTNASVFYPPSVYVPGGLQTLLPSLFTNLSVFYAPTVVANDPGGTYPLAIEGDPSTVKGRLLSGGSVVAGSIPSSGRVIAGYLRGRP